LFLLQLVKQEDKAEKEKRWERRVSKTGLTLLSAINQVLSASILKKKSSVLEYAFRSEFSVHCINEQDGGGLDKRTHKERQLLEKKAERNNDFEVFQNTGNGFRRHMQFVLCRAVFLCP